MPTDPDQLRDDILAEWTAIGAFAVATNQTQADALKLLLAEGIAVPVAELFDSGGISLGTTNGLSLVGGVLSLGAASAGVAGAMTGAYATKLDGIAAGATVGVTTLAAVGAVPNANGASISGVTLTLQPASASFPGVVTTGTQTIAGAKTFTSTLTAAGLVVDTDLIATDTTNNRVGINTASPARALDVRSSDAASPAQIQNTNVQGLSALVTNNSSGTARAAFGSGNASSSVAILQNKAYAAGVDCDFLFPRIVSNVYTNTATISNSTGVWDFVSVPTVASVAVLTQTNTVTGITNKTFTSPTINGATTTGTIAMGTSTISGTPNFSGAATLGGVAILSQTNTVTGITNKSFTPESWTNMTLVNSWVTFGSPYATAGYRKLPDGNVQLRGAVKNGSSGTATITTLAAGYRPTETIIVPVNSNGRIVDLIITTAGVVSAAVTGDGSPDTIEIVLNNVIFPTT